MKTTDELLEDCIHEEREPRLRTLINGSTAIYVQCLSCGAALGAVKKELITWTLEPFNDALRESYSSRRSAAFRKQRIEEKGKWFEAYSHYLKSSEWKEVRARVLRRAQGVCEGCGIKEAAEVHHLTYDHWGNEFLFELMAVCSDCHERLHAYKKQEAA